MKKNRLITVVALLLLSGCAIYKPSQVADVCGIFWGETDWYKDARKANKRWGTPIGVTMAIINQESSFRACLLYTSPSPRDVEESRMPSSA